jgi:NAD(P)-dependent dehydrogenase (short-subunit alcohol dehydrogenase family)
MAGPDTSGTHEASLANDTFPPAGRPPQPGARRRARPRPCGGAARGWWLRRGAGPRGDAHRGVPRRGHQAPADHAFVNNASTIDPTAFQEVTEEDVDALMELNLRAAQAVACRMPKDSMKGIIVDVSSQMGHGGELRRSVCCASK